jgi:ribosomal protein S12 methylthiotransferase accessory factor
VSGVLASYTHGTHRLVSPERTLARIEPVLEACGITRLADVTRLDELGVPVYCSIRPDAMILQVSNGKGLSADAAQVSALMEGIELHHAETPDRARLRRASLRELRGAGSAVVEPDSIEGYLPRYLSDSFVVDWTEGEDLQTGELTWAPASAVFFGMNPSLHDTNTNGLASGNHLVEATLHALYELMERDAGARVVVDGRLRIRERCRIVDPQTIRDRDCRDLVDAVEAAGTKVVLLWVDGGLPVHTFWAVFLNKRALAPVSTFSVGWGTHLDAGVAACRALTEAAQSRATIIHGAREDIQIKPVLRAELVQSSEAFRYFDALERDADWTEVVRHPEWGGAREVRDMEACLDFLLGALGRAGHAPIVRFVLTKPGLDIPVVKLIAPTLRINRRLL